MHLYVSTYITAMISTYIKFAIRNTFRNGRLNKFGASVLFEFHQKKDKYYAISGVSTCNPLSPKSTADGPSVDVSF
jgi:hypothetical protein